MREMGRLPSNDMRFILWPNTRTSVASYKSPKATDFDDPHGDWCHLDDDWGYGVHAHVIGSMQSTIYEW